MSIVVWAIMLCTNFTIIMITAISLAAMLMERIMVFHLDMGYLFVHEKDVCLPEMKPINM